MKSDNKRELTPRLRFPEFRKAEGWREIPIGDKVDLLSGYPFDGTDICEDSTGTKLLRGINITEGAIRHTPEIDRYFLGNKDGLKKFEVIENDLVIGMDGSKVGKNSALISSDDAGALLVQRVARLRTTDPSLIRFLFLHVNSPLFHRYVDKINTSSGIPHISAKQIKDFVICFPSEREQQKIADCLTPLDEVIVAQGRKVETLKAHKKALVQQLFPREVETLPRLRFREFRDAPEWEIKPLSRVAENLDNKRIPITEKDRNTGEVPYYGASGIVDYVNGHIFDEDLLCVSEDGANLVARTYPIAFAITGKTWVNNHAHVLRFADSATQKLVEVYLNVTDLRDFITGMAQPKLNRAMLDKIPMPLPGLAEQQQIADCLSSLDARIAAEADKLAALKTHKKGLMQQLFPSPEGE